MAVDAPDGAQAPPSGEGGRVARPRTTFLQRNLVLALKHAQPDLTLMAIAGAVGISEASVRRILAYQEADIKASTKGVMATAILERLDDWARASRVAAKKGYHQPAKDFIEAAGGIDAKAPIQTSVSVQPAISLSMNFGLGALAGYQPVQAQAPAIEAQAVPVLPAKTEASES
jgi:hypothetical protein